MPAPRIAPDHCRIVVIDDINETRTEVESPQSASEALDNHGLLALANDRAVCQEDDDPIAVSIQVAKSEDLIIVRWFDNGGDLDAAKAALQQAQGEWRGQR